MNVTVETPREFIHIADVEIESPRLHGFSEGSLVLVCKNRLAAVFAPGAWRAIKNVDEVL